MAEFLCNGCGYSREVREDLAGKRGKCPKCGQTGPVFPSDEQSVQIAIETSDTPAAASQAKSRWYWPDHPAKRAMVIASVVWGVIWMLLFAKTTFSLISNDPTAGIDFTRACVWLAFYHANEFCLPLYFATIGVCFVAYFVMSDAKAAKSA